MSNENHEEDLHDIHQDENEKDEKSTPLINKTPKSDTFETNFPDPEVNQPHSPVEEKTPLVKEKTPKYDSFETNFPDTEVEKNFQPDDGNLLQIITNDTQTKTEENTQNQPPVEEEDENMKEFHRQEAERMKEAKRLEEEKMNQEKTNFGEKNVKKGEILDLPNEMWYNILNYSQKSDLLNVSLSSKKLFSLSCK